MAAAAQIAEEVDLPALPAAPAQVGRPRKYRVSAPASGELIPSSRQWLLNWVGQIRALPPYITDDDVDRDFGMGRHNVYVQMATTDPEIASSLDIISLLALAQEVQIEPGADQDDANYAQAKVYADFCAANLRRLQTSLQDTLYELDHDAMVEGHKYAEIVLEYGVLNPADGPQLLLSALKTKPNDAYWQVTDFNNNLLGLLPRYTVRRYYLGRPMIFDEVKDDLIPPTKFLKRVNRARNGDWGGTSDLRVVWHPWWQKVQKLPDYNMFLATGARPIPVYMQRQGSTWQPPPDALGNPQEASDVALAMMESIRNDSVGFVPDGDNIIWFEPKSNGEAFEKAFDRDDRNIRQALTNQQLATGQSQYQPKASASIHQDNLMLKPRAHMFSNAHMLEHDLFDLLLRLNFAGYNSSLCPRAMFGQTAMWDLNSSGQVIAQMALAKAILPSQMPDAHVSMGLKKASRADYEKYDEGFWLSMARGEAQEVPPGQPAAPQPGATQPKGPAQ